MDSALYKLWKITTLAKGHVTETYLDLMLVTYSEEFLMYLDWNRENSSVLIQ